jgi:hypothetical protein
MSGFWRNWMMAWCGAVALFGLMLMGGAFDATSAPTRIFFGIIGGGRELNLDDQMRFSMAVLGAVTLGWSVTMLGAIQAAILLAERGGPAWRMVAAGVVAWFVTDTPLSIATGYGVNAIPNVIFLAAFLLPLFASGVLTRRSA